MREIRTVQRSIFETYGAHAIGLELKATLQETISAIGDVTWERIINLSLLDSARQARVENAEMRRIDSTVSDSPIHEPSDSAYGVPCWCACSKRLRSWR